MKYIFLTFTMEGVTESLYISLDCGMKRLVETIVLRCGGISLFDR